MEPDTLASPNASGDGPERIPRKEDLLAAYRIDTAAVRDAAPPLGGDVGMTAASSLIPGMPAAHGHAPAAPGAHAANGHANGHTNGHAAWGVVTLPAVTRSAIEPVALPGRGKTFYLRGGKRVLDLAGAAVAIVLSAPILILAAILVKLESRGPVLYRSKRVGRGGKSFTFYKLRSMVNGADLNRHHLFHLNETDGPVFKIARDPRVTRVGRFLRTTSIDELPQLINVLRGEMSLVGPRPPLAEEVAQYEPWQFRRLEVRPGLTCLWQISGRSRIGFQEWMRLDLEYIRRQSFWLDVKILIRTIPAVLSREGAY
ncbi:MAG TPA: sugar transferase [Candidatus Eisenbacteria bacterium]